MWHRRGDVGDQATCSELVKPESHNPAYEKWNEADLPLKLRPHRYQPIERTAGQFKTVAALIEKASEIVHAGDPDAEGSSFVSKNSFKRANFNY